MRSLLLLSGALLLLLLNGVSSLGQTLSTHALLRVFAAEGDLFSADLTAVYGRWEAAIFNLPTKTDFFEANYLADANADGKFEVGVDPFYTIKGSPTLATASATVRCSSGQPLFTQIRVHVLLNVELFVNGQRRGSTQSATAFFLSDRLRGPWLMTLALDLNGDGISESVLGTSTRFSPPLILPACPP
ncbi:hypothetical protein LM602_03670 [Candidatus Acetothermia bacterium]|jgi:hypothetical protein|nr:hypothetical protein [Candidatus Acetothermia bacterium]MCI2436356.1 hypothetical protein [Candidatus Acetothermia bacterium]